MEWIWQLKKWSQFEYNVDLLTEYERQFHSNVGKVFGAISHLEASNLEHLKIDILTQEAVSTSSIEGEILQRDSVQSSIKKHLGLKSDDKKILPNVIGISEMMVDVYLNYDKPSTHETFFSWHSMLMKERKDLETIGNYRTHTEPMQIVSGNLSNQKVFYEAPPSFKVYDEMEKFIAWYNEQLAKQSGIPILVLAGIAHLYFEIIHPFEDGNGRIGRALVEKIISQKIKMPALNSFAKIIEIHKKEYYSALQACNNSLNINAWLNFFSRMLIESQEYTISMVDFLVLKSKLFSKFNTQLNERQSKVLLRIFDAGLEGFNGGLSAANYKSISKASPATITRDLQELVNLKILSKTGELKHTRYFLNLEKI